MREWKEEVALNKPRSREHKSKIGKTENEKQRQWSWREKASWFSVPHTCASTHECFLLLPAAKKTAERKWLLPVPLTQHIKGPILWALWHKCAIVAKGAVRHLQHWMGQLLNGGGGNCLISAARIPGWDKQAWVCLRKTFSTRRTQNLVAGD